MKKIIIYMLMFVLLSFSCFAIDYTNLQPYLTHKFDFRNNTNTTHINDIKNTSLSGVFTSLTWENNDTYGGVPYTLFANDSKDMALIKSTSLSANNVNLSIVICGKYGYSAPPTGNDSKVCLLGATVTNEFIVGARGHEAGVWSDRTPYSDIPSWNLWACYFFTYDATGDMLQYYWNSSNYVYQRNKTNTNMYLTGSGNNIALFGFYDGSTNLGGQYQWYGHINMFEVFNRTLKNDEINFISENPNWYFNGAPVSNSLIVNSIILKNTSNNVYGSTFTAFDLFKISANVTYNGVFNNTLNCTYNSSSIWEQYPGYGNNQSFYTNYYMNFTTYSNANVLNDVFTIRLCKEQVGTQSANIYVTDNLIESINTSTIPLCRNSFHEETIVSNQSYDVTMRLRVACGGVCNPANTLRIISYGRNTSSILSRQYSSHTEILYPNSSNSLYVDNDYGTHFFSDVGTKYLSVFCNNSVSNANLTTAYTIENFTIIGSLSEIEADNTTYTYSNGVLIPSSEYYIFKGGCSGSNIVTTMVNLTYNNGTFIGSGNDGILSLDKSSLPSDGMYNLSLFCKDVNFTLLVKGYFNITDNVNPIITWVSPDISGTMETDRYTTFPIEVIFSDVNLYRMNISCTNSFGINVFDSGYIYTNDTIADLIGNSNNLTILGAVTCVACGSDSHTMLKIRDLTYYQENGSVIFDDKVKITYIDNIVKESFTLEKLKDRYSFEPVTKLAKKDTKFLNYEVECLDDALRYIKTSGFNGHFVCGDIWIDFNMFGVSEKNYIITSLVGERYKITINLPSGGLSSLKTESVGIINTNCDTAYFTVVEPTVSSTGGFDADMSKSVVFIGFILIWITLIGLSLIFPVMAFIGGLLGITYAIWNPLVFPVYIIGIWIIVNICVMMYSIVRMSADN